jgi:hypothetical protein
MWIVNIALRRPYTLCGGAAHSFVYAFVLTRWRRYFPTIDIPVGPSCANTEDSTRRKWRIELPMSPANCRKAVGIEPNRYRSPDYRLVKVFFQPGADVRTQ